MFSVPQAWNDTVKRNAALLQSIIGPYMTLLAVHGGLQAIRIPRALHVKILQVLRPAETALRRLIVIAARNVVVEGRPRPSRVDSTTPPKKRGPRSRMQFRLYDRRPPFKFKDVTDTFRQSGPLPKIHVVCPLPPVSPLSHLWKREFPDPPRPSDPSIGAEKLCLRLQAFTSALENIPHQAKRLARWRLRREMRKDDPFVFSDPMLPGKPPGYKKRPLRTVEFVLNECHDRARAVVMEAARPGHDTS